MDYDQSWTFPHQAHNQVCADVVLMLRLPEYEHVSADLCSVYMCVCGAFMRNKLRLGHQRCSCDSVLSPTPPYHVPTHQPVIWLAWSRAEACYLLICHRPHISPHSKAGPLLHCPPTVAGIGPTTRSSANQMSTNHPPTVKQLEPVVRAKLCDNNLVM